MVYADHQQTRKHLWTHNYQELLKISRNRNLIQDYVTPIKRELVDMLAELSRVRSNQNG